MPITLELYKQLTQSPVNAVNGETPANPFATPPIFTQYGDQFWSGTISENTIQNMPVNSSSLTMDNYYKVLCRLGNAFCNTDGYRAYYHIDGNTSFPYIITNYLSATENTPAAYNDYLNCQHAIWKLLAQAKNQYAAPDLTYVIEYDDLVQAVAYLTQFKQTRIWSSNYWAFQSDGTDYNIPSPPDPNSTQYVVNNRYVVNDPYNKCFIGKSISCIYNLTYQWLNQTYPNVYPAAWPAYGSLNFSPSKYVFLKSINTSVSNIGTSADTSAATSVFGKIASVATTSTAMTTAVGTSADTSTANTVFGKIAAVQGSLGNIGTSADTAAVASLFGKIATINSSLAALNTVVSSIVSTVNTMSTSITSNTNTTNTNLQNISSAIQTLQNSVASSGGSSGNTQGGGSTTTATDPYWSTLLNSPWLIMLTVVIVISIAIKLFRG